MHLLLAGDRRHNLLLALLVVLVAASWVAYTTLPDPISRYFLSADFESRAIEWHDEVSEFNVLKPRHFNSNNIEPEAASVLSNFARMGGQYRISLFGADGKLFWTTGTQYEDKSITPPSHLLTGERWQLEVQLFDSPIGKIEEFVAAGAAYVPKGATDGSHRVASVLIPRIEQGSTIGYVKIYYDLEEIHSWYAHNISISIATLGILIVFVFAFCIGLTRWMDWKLRQAEQEQAEQEEVTQKANEERSRQIQAISELSEWLQSSKSLDELFTMVSRFMMLFFTNRCGAIYVYSESRDILKLNCSWNEGEQVIGYELKPDDCWGLRRGRMYTYGEGQFAFRCGHCADGASEWYFCLPISAQGETIGLLHLEPTPGAVWSEEDIARDKRIAAMCAEQISLSIANVRLRDQLHLKSLTDPLTKLHNRRGFNQDIAKLHRVAEKTNERFYLASLDIDHFKKFNDQYGHDAGDAVLVSLSEMLRDYTNTGVSCYRLGGEEFAVLLDDREESSALSFLEGLRRSVYGLAVNCGGQTLPPLTVSIGLAAYPDDGTTLEILAKNSDVALYRAKENGRNQLARFKDSDRKKTAKQLAPGKIPEDGAREVVHTALKADQEAPREPSVAANVVEVESAKKETGKRKTS